MLTALSIVAAVNPGQALLLGNIMSVFESEDFVDRGNFISLMFFIMSLGILVIYFVMGWSTNTIAQVRAHISLYNTLLTKVYRIIGSQQEDATRNSGVLSSAGPAFL